MDLVLSGLILFIHIIKKYGFRDNEGDTLSENKFVEYSLNDEVEVIEENKGIEELEISEKNKKMHTDYINSIADKLNEVINKLNKEREEK